MTACRPRSRLKASPEAVACPVTSSLATSRFSLRMVLIRAVFSADSLWCASSASRACRTQAPPCCTWCRKNSLSCWQPVLNHPHHQPT